MWSSIKALNTLGTVNAQWPYSKHLQFWVRSFYLVWLSLSSRLCLYFRSNVSLWRKSPDFQTISAWKSPAVLTWVYLRFSECFAPGSKVTFHSSEALPSVARLVHPLFITWEVFHVLSFFFERAHSLHISVSEGVTSPIIIILQFQVYPPTSELFWMCSRIYHCEKIRI